MVWLNDQIIDIALFIVGNLVNLLMVGIFLLRTKGLARAESILGLILLSLILPIGGAIILNIVGKRGVWNVLLPTLLVAFLLLEMVLDYILKLDFRNTWMLGPYLLLYYLALMGMIGYTFRIDRPFGFITLITYFLQLGATWYSYSQVGHG